MRLTVFFLLSSLGYSGELLCVVELTVPGVTAPEQLYPFDDAYWYPTELGELTSVGMRQHYLIGAELNQRFTVATNFLSPALNTSEVEVRSVSLNRTLMSTYSQLVGLFPMGAGPRLTSPPQPLPPIVVSNASNIEKALGTSALPLSWQAYSIRSVPTAQDFVLEGYKSTVCPRMSIYESWVLDGDDYQSKQNQLNMTLFRQLARVFPFPVVTIADAAKLCASIASDLAAGFPLPDKLTQEQFQQLRAVHGYYLFTVPFSNLDAVKLGLSGFWTEVESVFSQALVGGSKKFHLFTAATGLLAGVLTSLGTVLDVPPPFASVLQISLYDDSTVSITFNDQPIIVICPTPPCSFSAFQTYLSDVIWPDYQQRCTSLDTEVS